MQATQEDELHCALVSAFKLHNTAAVITGDTDMEWPCEAGKTRATCARGLEESVRETRAGKIFKAGLLPSRVVPNSACGPGGVDTRSALLIARAGPVVPTRRRHGRQGAELGWWTVATGAKKCYVADRVLQTRRRGTSMYVHKYVVCMYTSKSKACRQKIGQVA